jgi:S-adenosylmethionine/arginine decarboxylase-like enzyme
VADTTLVHLLADFIGVAPDRLRDATLVSGLLIAAGSAAGFNPLGAPAVRPHVGSDGLSAFVLLGGCHIIAHTFPDRELLVLDVLAAPPNDAVKAYDVFARRLAAREIRSEQRHRG